MNRSEKVARWLRKFVMEINREPLSDAWNEAIAAIWIPEAEKILSLINGDGEPMETCCARCGEGVTRSTYPLCNPCAAAILKGADDEAE